MRGIRGDDVRSRQPHNPRRTAPRGLTLLEVVLAVVMLSLVAAAITSAISTVEAMNTRSRQTVAAYELAHRLVLTALDDRERLPAETMPLEYGQYQFMWEREVGVVRMVANQSQRQHSAPLQATDRFRLMTVHIFSAEGDSSQPYKGIELASLSRMYDPTAPRNPESIKVYNDPRRVGDLIDSIFGSGATLPDRDSGRSTR